MITLLTIEPISDAHGALIVEAFSRFFIDAGGQQDGNGNGNGDGDGGGGNGYGYGYGYGDGSGYGYGWGYGDGDGDVYGKIPEEWRAD